MSRTPIHPGEILADELAEIARIIEVPANRISQIMAGKGLLPRILRYGWHSILE